MLIKVEVLNKKGELAKYIVPENSVELTTLLALADLAEFAYDVTTWGNKLRKPPKRRMQRSDLELSPNVLDLALRAAELRARGGS